MFGRPERRSTNKLVQLERERIQKNEIITGRRTELERERNVMQKVRFQEADQTGFKKALIRQELTQKQEVKNSHTLLTMVRKEALVELLDQDRRLYEFELRQRGLAIYQQRI